MKSILMIICVVLALMIPCSTLADTIDVMIKGVDNGVKSSKQQDYKEAVMNAKLEAIERAGVQIQAITKVVNFQTKFDMVESKAKAILLPGFRVMDMGYSSDGTYQVVLSGKVKTVSEGFDSKDLRYAKTLVERGQTNRARKIINDILENSKDDNVIAEAMYCQVLWSFASNERDTFEKLKAYYPNSKYVSRVKTILIERKRKKRIEHNRKNTEWRNKISTRAKIVVINPYNIKTVGLAAKIDNIIPAQRDWKRNWQDVRLSGSNQYGTDMPDGTWEYKGSRPSKVVIVDKMINAGNHKLGVWIGGQYVNRSNCPPIINFEVRQGKTTVIKLRLEEDNRKEYHNTVVVDSITYE